MRIGIAWHPESGTEAEIKKLYEYKALGYDCVDFQAFMDTDNIYFGEKEKSRQILKEIRSTAENAGIAISQTHGPWRWPPIDGTEEGRAERLQKMIYALEGTAELGCHYMVIHPLMPFFDQNNQDIQQVTRINTDFFENLLAAAEKIGVVVCLENMPMPWLPIATPKQILDFVRTFKSHNFRICLDTGHCSVLHIAPDDAVRTIGKEYLRVLHIHDNDGVRDWHWLPETGVIDWNAFAAALNEISFEGVFSLETDVPIEGLTSDEILEKKKSLAITARRIANQGHKLIL